MGRKQEFKVGKSFTLTIKTIGWLAEQCAEQDMKASEWLERLICKERERLYEKKKQDNKFHCVYCDKKVVLQVEGLVNQKYLCSECGKDHTAKVKYLMRMSKNGSKKST
jgi:transposase-like protein